jgi:integrase
MQQSILTHQQAMKAKKAGLYRDGNGLYLQITPGGVKSWIVRYMIRGRARYMGIGPFPAVSLAEARQRAGEVRRTVRVDGQDPLELRATAKAKQKLLDAKNLTFRDCAAAFIAANQAGWKNEKHSWQWTRSLEMYVYPLMGEVAVGEIDTALVLKVLEPIWTSITETASRLRGRMEKILGYAITAGYRQGENPARWKSHLENLLPKPSQVSRVENQPALPWRQVPEFMMELRKMQRVSARALEFTIVTCARTTESLGARWREIDWESRTWTVPASRIKAKREHRVPLSDRAVAILQMMSADGNGADSYIFPGAKPGRPFSDMVMLMILRRMGRGDITTHGFRSSFRDWAAEATDAPHEVAEMALAHVIASKVEAAYRRGDLLDKRRRLMGQWAAYCELQTNHKQSDAADICIESADPISAEA